GICTCGVKLYIASNEWRDFRHGAVGGAFDGLLEALGKELVSGGFDGIEMSDQLPGLGVQRVEAGDDGLLFGQWWQRDLDCFDVTNLERNVCTSLHQWDQYAIFGCGEVVVNKTGRNALSVFYNACAKNRT